MTYALELKNVSKQYENFALQNISLVLPRGCIMGMIGENGAGKSTTIKLLLDLIKRDGGEIEVLGVPAETFSAERNAAIGVVMDECSIPDMFHVKQVDAVMRDIYANWDSETFYQLISRFGLPLKSKIKTYSRGMKMKLSIAVALSHNAQLLILDEATSGLDPVVRDDVTDLLLDFTRDEGHSILLSSHIVSDLEKVCDYIAFLHKGKLMLMEEKDALTNEYGLLQCSLTEAAQIDPAAVIGRRDTPYGCRLIVRRDAVPAGTALGSVSIEELFIFMVKEEQA